MIHISHIGWFQVLKHFFFSKLLCNVRLYIVIAFQGVSIYSKVSFPYSIFLLQFFYNFRLIFFCVLLFFYKLLLAYHLYYITFQTFNQIAVHFPQSSFVYQVLNLYRVLSLQSNLLYLCLPFLLFQRL